MLNNNEEYSHIEIIFEKYLYLNEIALKSICNKFEIPLNFKINGYDIAKQIIPQTFVRDGFLENFYHKLPSNIKKILKYIVNYSGNSIEKDVKKKFHYSILLMLKDNMSVYVWWLEPFINEDEFEPVFKEIFLEFLSENRKNKKSKQLQKKKKLESSENSNSFKNIGDALVRKMTMDTQVISQHLDQLKAQDMINVVKIIYALGSDSKINITQKGLISVKNNRVLKEKIGKDFNYVLLINFLTEFKYLTFTKSREPTQEFHTLMTQEDSDMMKTLFGTYMNSQKNHELMNMDFYNARNIHNNVKLLREMVLNIILGETPSLWISVDYIVDKIKIDAKTLLLVTDSYEYAYGFYGNGWRISHNKLEHLKVVIRYFVKNFLVQMNYFSLCDIGLTKSVLFHKNDVGILKNMNLESQNNAIEYYRLSELGKSVFDLQNKYKSSNDYMLVLNEYILEIKVENPNDFSEILLEKIALKIDAHRYKMDMKSFMKHLNSKEECETTLTILRNKSKNIPNNWMYFFDLLDKRVRSASVVSDTAVLIKIKNDREILKLIASHEKLQEKIIKADKLQLVVLQKDMSFVKRVFKEFGIII